MSSLTTLLASTESDGPGLVDAVDNLSSSMTTFITPTFVFLGAVMIVIGGLRMRLAAGGKILEISTFPNYFAATVARSELLEDVYPFRVQLRNTKLASGAGKAFLEDAPRKPLRSYRKQARTTIRQTTSEAK